MAKVVAKGGLNGLMAFVVWAVGILVSLSIGFSMIDGVLTLPTWLGGAITAMIVGWVVVILTIVGVIAGIVKGLAR